MLYRCFKLTKALQLTALYLAIYTYPDRSFPFAIAAFMGKNSGVIAVFLALIILSGLSSKSAEAGRVLGDHHLQPNEEEKYCSPPPIAADTSLRRAPGVGPPAPKSNTNFQPFLPVTPPLQ